jgi:chemotaxis family two-component system response regulator Rcp1
MSPPTLTWPTTDPAGERMAARPTRHPVEILLVEDSAGDAELMVEALLSESDLAPRITVIEDGESAVRYLRRQGDYHAAPRPDLILLDLHLPRKNGHEVLADIKQDENLRLIPVILLTSFDTEEAIREAYDRHVNCCVRKPSDLDQFALAVKKIETFWLQMARLHRQP